MRYFALVCDGGQVIVTTRSGHEHDVVEVIRELGLLFQLVFNKGAVMILPSGVNRTSGLLRRCRK